MCSRIPPSTVLTFEVLLSSQRGWLTQLSKYWLREILGWQLLKLFLLCLGSPKTRSAPQIGPKTVGSSCPKSYPRALVPKSADCCGVRCTQQIRVTKTQNQNKSAASLGQPSDLFTLAQRGWGGGAPKTNPLLFAQVGRRKAGGSSSPPVRSKCGNLNLMYQLILLADRPVVLKRSLVSWGWPMGRWSQIGPIAGLLEAESRLQLSKLGKSPPLVSCESCDLRFRRLGEAVKDDFEQVMLGWFWKV